MIRLLGTIGLAGVVLGCEEGAPGTEESAVSGTCKSAVEQCVGGGASGASCGQQLEGCVNAALSASSSNPESLCEEVATACVDAGGLPETCDAIRAACLEVASSSSASGEPAESSESPESSGPEGAEAETPAAETPAAEDPQSEPSPSEEPSPDVDPLAEPSVDVAPPTVSYDSVPTQVVAGTTLTFTWRASDPSGISEGSSNAWIGGPSGWVDWCGLPIPGVVVSVDGPSILYQVSCAVPANAVNQTYSIFINAQDSFANAGSVSPGADGIGDFEVVGGSSDAEPPVFSDVEVPPTVAPGATFTMKWRVVDPSGVDSSAWVVGPAGLADQFGSFQEGWELERLPVSDTESVFVLTVRLAERAPGGTYEVWISARDGLGNKKFEGSGVTFFVDCTEALVQCLASAGSAEACSLAAAQCEGTDDGSNPDDGPLPEADGEDEIPASEPEAPPEDASSPSPGAEQAAGGDLPSDVPADGQAADSQPASAEAAKAAISPCFGGYLACKAAAPGAPECKAALAACSA
jgi:hypothetical protein